MSQERTILSSPLWVGCFSLTLNPSPAGRGKPLANASATFPPPARTPLKTAKNFLAKSLLLALSVLSFSIVERATAQVVSVTLRLAKDKLAVGETTTLHVSAQIVPARRAETERIFSWYVDLLNGNGGVAKLTPEALAKTSSDQDPLTSSTGTTDTVHRRGIYDTFLNLAGAGRDTAVELFSIPVQAITPGKTTLSVTTGTGAAGLGADFIVAPTGGGDPMLGGDYSAASISLEVTGGLVQPTLALTAAPLATGQGVFVTLTFPISAGASHVVEFRDSLSLDAAWQPLPGAPHNSGSATDSPAVALRFYRLRLSNP